MTQLVCEIRLAESTLSDIELRKRIAWSSVRKAVIKALNILEEQLFPED